jgi:ribonuclease HII
MNLRKEKYLWKKGYKHVAGLDEAGRGPLAGPVVAAAVIISTKRKKKNAKLQFKAKSLLKEVKDSKKLSPKRRETLYKLLVKEPNIEWGIGRVSEKMIDKINILKATKFAMKKAVSNLKIDYLILDGNFKIDLHIPQKSIKKGDSKVFSIAAASIIAKVTRDRIMKRYHKKHPEYGFDKHKGYATKFHRQALKKHGPCKIHRMSFRPIRLL